MLVEPLLSNRSPSPAAQSDGARPRTSSVLVFPHCEKWALKSPRRRIWLGRYRLTQSPIPSRNSSNATRPMFEETCTSSTTGSQPTGSRHRWIATLERDTVLARARPPPLRRPCSCLSSRRAGLGRSPQISLQETHESIYPSPWPPRAIYHVRGPFIVSR